MFVKFSSAAVIDAAIAPAGKRDLRRFAHRHHFDYEPRPDYLYVRSRAISSRTNDNFDCFPADEIKVAYKTFVGKPVFVNHNNADHRRARGVIIDAALHEDFNPDGTPDTWVEVLMEVDAKRFPKLAQAILSGHIDRTSMGTDVAFSKCSFCGNTATTPLEYCRHIPRMKGQRIERTTASGQKESVLVYEICHGLKFFENSLLVEPPADPTAFFLGVEDGSKLSSMASKTAEFDFVPRPRRWKKDQTEPSAAEHNYNHFWANNKVDHMHIVNRYINSTPEEKEQGHRWYSDAHHVAKAITHGDAAKGAGLLSAYSPQADWPANMFNASHSFRREQDHPGAGAVGPRSDDRGRGNVTGPTHQAAAQRILNGEHHSKVLTGAKTRSFAHLIEHGGRDPHTGGLDMHHVVVDTHALSVATNRRQNGKSAGDSGIFKGEHDYNHVADAYRRAADHLSKHYGYDIAPHQVQATTWINQKAENDRNDAASGDQKARGRIKLHDNNVEHWQQHMLEHGIDFGGKYMNMHSKLIAAFQKEAYGETIAPADVDTLRDEECPVCQEKDSYDGNECQVCGFVQPPQMFRDPDLDKAKEIDLRKDVLEDDPRDPQDPQDTDPSATDAQGMPGEIPGSQTPGSDQVPLDPTNLDENGQPLDPTGIDGKPQVDPSMQPMLDPNMPMDPKLLDQQGMPVGPDGQPIPGGNVKGLPTDDPAMNAEHIPPTGAEDLPAGAPDQGETLQTGPDGDQKIKPPIEPDELGQDGNTLRPEINPEPDIVDDENSPLRRREDGGVSLTPKVPGEDDPQDMLEEGKDPTEIMGRPLEPGEVTDIYGQPLGPDGPLDEEEREEAGVKGPQDGNTLPGSFNTDEEMQPPGAGDDFTPGGASGPQFAPDGQEYDTAQEGDETSQLECPACHKQFTSAPPTSVTTDNPEGTQDGIVEGDICPNCGQALLIVVGNGTDEADTGEDDVFPSVGAEATGDKMDNNRDTTPQGKNKLSSRIATRVGVAIPYDKHGEALYAHPDINGPNHAEAQSVSHLKEIIKSKSGHRWDEHNATFQNARVHRWTFVDDRSKEKTHFPAGGGLADGKSHMGSFIDLFR